MAHTPGPWWNTELELQSKPYPGIEIWGWPDSEHEYQVFVALVLSTQASIPLDQTQANATLIAAAPDMLEACEAFCLFDWDTLLAEAGGDPYSPRHSWPEFMALIGAAVAKARGE